MYGAQSGNYTPLDGQPEDPDYLEYIRSLVINKINYSRYVADRNYFNYVLEALPS